MDIDKIKSAIYTWGFYPALYILREEQQNENYENCNVIKKALDEVSNSHKLGLKTKVDRESMEQAYESIMRGLNKPKLIDSNMEYYINEFKKYLEVKE